MSWTIWMASAVVCLTVWALIKRWETRLVLLVAGLIMAVLSGDPLSAFRQFDKSMTNPNLIIAICSAIGFAGVVTITKCDVHLVALLTKPLKKIGVLLLPLCGVVTSVIALALPSTAGTCAAVGPTLIPLMVRAGFKPAAAAAVIVGSITPALLNPGVSHNVFVAKIAGMEVMDFIAKFAPITIALSAIAIAGITVFSLLYGDYKPADAAAAEASAAHAEGAAKVILPEHPNILFAVAPLVPVVILVCASIWAPQLKLSVASAMILGMIYAVAVTRTAPDKATKEFFNGMGSGYAKILGIIIAAGVFAAGLRAAGVVDVFVNYLTHAQEVAKLGGALGPFVLALLTGSGDAAAFAFNEAVTPHAAQFGLTVDGLGYLAALAGGVGRPASPLCGGLILVAGIAAVSPVEVAKRTAPAMVLCLIALYILI